MIVPEFWAEAVLKERHERRSVTIRRFGWSDASVADAQANADARARDALARVLAGEPLLRRERKQAYNGADGLPIREQVVARHGESVVTRNAYGARCLNTPDVLFADIDFADVTAHAATVRSFALAAAWRLAAALAAIGCGRTGHGGIALALVLAILVPWRSLAARARTAARGGAEAIVRGRIESFAASHPDWGLRLYRTPAGMRVLATHRSFDAREAATLELFEALGVDAIYRAMCLNQRCFRARLTAKPWRIGIGDHLRPRSGVWPVAPDRMARRDAWLRDYELAAANWAACRLVGTLGETAMPPAIADVVRLHDQACRATTDLPLA